MHAHLWQRWDARFVNHTTSETSARPEFWIPSEEQAYALSADVYKEVVVRKEPHQMRGAELRRAKEELETRLRACANDVRESQELSRRIEELDAELRRRAQIGHSGRSPSDRESARSTDHPADRT